MANDARVKLTRISILPNALSACLMDAGVLAFERSASIEKLAAEV